MSGFVAIRNESGLGLSTEPASSTALVSEYYGAMCAGVYALPILCDVP